MNAGDGTNTMKEPKKLNYFKTQKIASPFQKKEVSTVLQLQVSAFPLEISSQHGYKVVLWDGQKDRHIN